MNKGETDKNNYMPWKQTSIELKNLFNEHFRIES